MVRLPRTQIEARILISLPPVGGNGAGILSLHKSEEGFTYTEGNGTSMAAPHAAGIFALMKGLHPDITPERVRSFIEAGVITQEMGDEGFDTLSGYGLLDAEESDKRGFGRRCRYL